MAAHSAPDRMYGQIARLTMELDWLKEVLDQLAMMPHTRINKGATLALTWLRLDLGVAQRGLCAAKTILWEDDWRSSTGTPDGC